MCDPINKSDNSIIRIGIKIANLFLIYKPDINAIVSIGVKLGAWGTNLKRIPTKIKKPQNKYAILSLSISTCNLVFK